jgi:hypothetical protein
MFKWLFPKGISKSFVTTPTMTFDEAVLKLHAKNLTYVEPEIARKSCETSEERLKRFHESFQETIVEKIRNVVIRESLQEIPSKYFSIVVYFSQDTPRDFVFSKEYFTTLHRDICLEKCFELVYLHFKFEICSSKTGDLFDDTNYLSLWIHGKLNCLSNIPDDLTKPFETQDELHYNSWQFSESPFGKTFEELSELP